MESGLRLPAEPQPVLMRHQRVLRLKLIIQVSNTWVGVSNANNQFYNTTGLHGFCQGRQNGKWHDSNHTENQPYYDRRVTLITGSQPAISVSPDHYQSSAILTPRQSILPNLTRQMVWMISFMHGILIYMEFMVMVAIKH